VIDWLIRLVRRRIAAMDRAEAATAERRDVAISELCILANAPQLATGFIRHGVSLLAVTHTLAGAIQRDPAASRGALSALEFLAPEESATTWDRLDRQWLRDMERSFGGSRDAG
jgi:hypothetical protein